jgi:hypothetical protein
MAYYSAAQFNASLATTLPRTLPRNGSSNQQAVMQ